MMQKENWAGHKKRLEWLYNEIISMKKKDVRILEVGCGSGLYITLPIKLFLMRDNIHGDIRGIDIANSSIQKAKEFAQKHGVDPDIFVCKDVSEIPDNSYDFVICSEVLEHIDNENIEEMVNNLIRVCKPGGGILITVPNGKGSYEKGQIRWKKFQKWMDSPKIAKARKIYHKFKKQNGEEKEELPMTFSDSPHVQFFSKMDVERLFGGKCNLEKFTGSSIFYNNFFDAFVPAIPFFTGINNRLADKYPLKASGYYFRFLKRDETVKGKEKEL